MAHHMDNSYVWIVEKKTYNKMNIEGVFSNKKKAINYVKLNMNNNNENKWQLFRENSSMIEWVQDQKVSLKFYSIERKLVE